MTPKIEICALSIHGVVISMPPVIVSVRASRQQEQTQKEARGKDAVGVWHRWLHGTLKAGSHVARM